MYYFFSQYVLKCTFFFAIGSTFAVEVQYSTKQEKYEIKINDEKSTQDVGTADIALVHDEGAATHTVVAHWEFTTGYDVEKNGATAIYTPNTLGWSAPHLTRMYADS